MKTYQTNQVKNITLLGNSGSGKTTLAESLLLAGGVISRKGDVNQKTTASDFREIEQENQRSIYSTVLYAEYNDKKVNFLDAPGADDFIGHVVSSQNSEVRSKRQRRCCCNGHQQPERSRGWN